MIFVDLVHDPFHGLLHWASPFAVLGERRMICLLADIEHDPTPGYQSPLYNGHSIVDITIFWRHN